MSNKLQKGFQTHSRDMDDDIICLGDTLDYKFEGDIPCPFEVVFEDNAFRKKYNTWDDNVVKPILPIGHETKRMKIKIIKKWNQ